MILLAFSFTCVRLSSDLVQKSSDEWFATTFLYRKHGEFLTRFLVKKKLDVFTITSVVDLAVLETLRDVILLLGVTMFW